MARSPIWTALLCGLLAIPATAWSQGIEEVPEGGKAEALDRAAQTGRVERDVPCGFPVCRGFHCETPMYQALVQALRRAFTASQAANVLVLSGGGSRGAWGAGVLNGWTQATTGPSRPSFGMVTGISTGAVQATAAFLGTPADDSRLEEGYTTTRNGDVYGFPYPVIGFPRNLKALRSTLAEPAYIPDTVIDQVRDVARTSDRKLYVGTVDLETSHFISWDMTCLADKEEYDLYREVILASSANPAGIWPIELRGHPHADGGVRYRVYVEALLQASGEAAFRLRGLTEKRIYYVINGKLGIEPKSVSSWWFPGVMERGLDIALKESIFGSLYGAWYLLNGGQVEWEFLGSWIPESVVHSIDLPKSDQYDPAKMLPLFEAGKDWGKANTWIAGLPQAQREKWGCEEE